MSQEKDMEELRELFRSFPPDDILKFFKTLPEKNQQMIKYWAHEFAKYDSKKATHWERGFDHEGRKYYQNRQTKETHWASAMTGGSGALDISTGTYHVPLD